MAGLEIGHWFSNLGQIVGHMSDLMYDGNKSRDRKVGD